MVRIIGFVVGLGFVVMLMVTVIAVLVVSVWGLTTVYINERFQTGVRATVGVSSGVTAVPHHRDQRLRARPDDREAGQVEEIEERRWIHPAKRAVERERR